jgi:hypothetical protein
LTVPAAPSACAYAALALRLDRLLPGLVAARPAELSLGTAEPASPSALVREAGRLAGRLREEGLEPPRERFLAAQVDALECTARRLAGQRLTFVEEVTRCFGVRPALADPAIYRQAHRDLDVLLPGRGPLAERLAAHRRRDEVPPARLLNALRALSADLRDRTRARWPLPTDESVHYRLVEGAPWAALHRFHGPHRSVVSVNVAARPRHGQLPRLVAHEAYPGHHTERCRKNLTLVAERGWREHALAVVRSPQSVVAEGAAQLALDMVVGAGWGGWAEEVLRGIGLGFDGELAERLDLATAVLRRVRLDAALMLHERRVAPAEVSAYVGRWLLVGDAAARSLVDGLASRLWRGYAVTYVEGIRMVRGWCGGGLAVAQRYGELLDEPVTPGTLDPVAAA